MRELIAFRKRNPVLGFDAFYTADDLEWFGDGGQPPQWDGNSGTLGVLVRPHSPTRRGFSRQRSCLLFNAAATPADFRLPSVASCWRLCLDTGKTFPDDIVAAGAGPPIPH